MTKEKELNMNAIIIMHFSLTCLIRLCDVHKQYINNYVLVFRVPVLQLQKQHIHIDTIYVANGKDAMRVFSCLRGNNK